MGDTNFIKEGDLIHIVPESGVELPRTHGEFPICASDDHKAFVAQPDTTVIAGARTS